MKPVVLVAYFDRAFALPALYGAIVVAVLLCLLVVAALEAIFGSDERAKRAFRVFKEILRLFHWRSQ